MKRSTSIFFLAACLFSLVQAQDSNSNCFTQEGDVFTEYDTKIYAASPTRECGDDEKKCQVESQNIHVTVKRFLNVSTDKADDVFHVIGEATSLTFEESVSDDVDAGGDCIMGPGDKFYDGYSLEYRCVNGTLGDCVEGLEAGLPVKACSPDTSDTGNGKTLGGKLEYMLVNGTDGPDVAFASAEASASVFAVDIGLLPLLPFLVVAGGFLTFPLCNGSRCECGI
jgi:hypothetical protein